MKHNNNVFISVKPLVVRIRQSTCFFCSMVWRMIQGKGQSDVAAF